KIEAVQSIFGEANITPVHVSTGVSEQPFSDEETKIGAINRAKACIKQCNTDLAIGLEGGVMRQKNELYLCNWGALITLEHKVYIASGARILLPLEIVKELEKGKALGNIM